MFIKKAGFTFLQVKTQSTSRATLPRKVYKKNSSAGVKEKLSMGKENAARKVAANQNCNEGVPAAIVLRSQRTTQHSRLQKADIAGSVASTKLVFVVNFTLLLLRLFFERLLFIDFCQTSNGSCFVILVECKHRLDFLELFCEIHMFDSYIFIKIKTDKFGNSGLCPLSH